MSLAADSDLRETHDKLQNDLPFYSETALRIQVKGGKTVPFVLNKSQEYIHELLEQQRRDTGKVRALILKGRQLGSSTYVGARYFHKAITTPGQGVFILAHDTETSQKLFRMTKRYYEYLPPQLVVPAKTSNRKELIFEGLNSSYSVGTAGSGNVGRGTTSQYFHGSEVAFWPNADEITLGILQSVPDIEGSEVIMESTANGMQGMFYEMCIQAAAGEGDFQLIFVPWFWGEDYVRKVPPGFVLTVDEEEYKNLYDLTLEQMAWRRAKIETEFRGKLWRFRQEYPANAQEAFQTSGDSFVKAEAIVRARCAKFKDNYAPLVIGVDPARGMSLAHSMGWVSDADEEGKGDRTVLAFRQGRTLLKVKTFRQMDEMKLAGILAQYIERYPKRIHSVNIDYGCGSGTFDRLKEMGYGKYVNIIHAGSGAIDAKKFANKRVEMAFDFRDWLYEGEVSIPDEDAIQMDIAAVPDSVVSSNMKEILPSKYEIKKKYGGVSPDIFDAICLTFALPIMVDTLTTQNIRKIKYANKRGGLKTRNRVNTGVR